jgi:WD40-like Beta Propeller Repeat
LETGVFVSAGQPSRAARAARRLIAVAVVLLAPAAPASADDRAYELVSPPQKNGLDVDPVRSAPTPAGSLLMSAYGDFGGSAGASLNQYLARRRPDGWRTQPLIPAKQGGDPAFWGALNSGVVDVAADDVTSVLSHTQSFGFPDDEEPGQFGRWPDLFRYDLDTLAAEWISRGTTGEDTADVPIYAGASADFQHVVFKTDQPHEPQHPPDEEALYETVGDGLRLVGVVGPDPGVAYPQDVGLGSAHGDYSGGSAHNAVSADGSRIYFTRFEADPGGPLPSSFFHGSTVGSLHLREHSAAAPDGRTIDVADDATYLTATPDGGKAFFTTTAQLVAADADTERDVYDYDVAADAYRLVAQGAGIFARMSDDGGAGILMTVESNASGTESTYRLLSVGEQAVAEVAAIPSGLYDTGLRHAARWACGGLQVTPDGRHAAFATVDALDPADTDAAADTYLYDAATGTLTLASAGGDADVPADPATGLVGANAAPCERSLALERRFVSDDGRRVAFQTDEALVAADVNDRVDVYEYDVADGAVTLVTSGAGERDSRFVALSRDGADLFFVTRERLVAQDTDENADAYTARVGGGFPAVAQPAPPCAEDACQPAGPPAPGFAPLASETHHGPEGTSTTQRRPGPPAAARISVRRLTRAMLRRAARTGRLAVVVRATHAGRLTAVLRAGRRRIARAARSLARAGTVRLTLTLSARARRALARSGRLRLRLVVRHSGVPRPVTRGLTLRVPGVRRG